MTGIFISAAHKSSGKTTLSIGLCAALTDQGLAVQPFKKGPDYIDPMWLSLASQQACRNLDFNIAGHDEILANYASYCRPADICVVEGNKGLYDGMDLDGGNSNAAMAKLLRLPVILVIDAQGMSRGVAPLLLGYQAFDREVEIAGVILNNIAGERHESKVRAVVEHYTDLPVIGAVRRNPAMRILERHLGLVPSNETGEALERVRQIGAYVAQQVDLNRVVAIAKRAPRIETPPAPQFSAHRVQGQPIRIGVARDKAFGFYYEDDLDALRQAGGTLVYLNMLEDRHLSSIDALFIGGGFPELFLDKLEANVTLRRELKHSIDAGLPVYAECGGLMYLARTIHWNGETRRMVGAIPGDVIMNTKSIGRGYVRLRETGNSPWPAVGMAPAGEINAHEFHYSSLQNLDGEVKFAYDVVRGYGIDGQHDGLIYKNLLASYTHLRSAQRYNWAARFMAFVRQCAASRREPPTVCDTTPVL